MPGALAASEDGQDAHPQDATESIVSAVSQASPASEENAGVCRGGVRLNTPSHCCARSRARARPAGA